MHGTSMQCFCVAQLMSWPAHVLAKSMLCVVDVSDVSISSAFVLKTLYIYREHI
jgi:hypothetical protein